ncbi:MAG: ABC transporter permease [Gemmatimonadaceae bacterium]
MQPQSSASADRFSWARLWQMVRKEIRQMWRDPKARPLLFLSPIMQMFLLGYAATTDVNNISTIVADHDRTAESRALINAYESTGYFTVVERTDRADEVTTALSEGRATVGLTIPPGFSRDLAAHHATVQAVIDASDANLANVAQSYAAQIASEFGAKMAGTTVAGGIELRSRAWFNPSFESRFFNVPAIMGILMFMIGLLLTALGVVREREIGTLDQLLVSPIQPSEFMLGKTIPVLGLAMVHLLIYTALTVFQFDVPLQGAFGTLALAAFIYTLAGLGLGLLISTVSRTQQEAFMLLILIFLPAVMLSGFLSPVESMPPVFQWLTYVNPIRYFMEIVRGVFLKGIGIDVLWPQFAVLTLMAVATLTYATRRFKYMVN